jgi:hypothetical protein
MAEALRHWEQIGRLQKRQCILFFVIPLIMKKIKPFFVKSMSSLTNEEMHCISGGQKDRFYTSCTLANVGEKCVYQEKEGHCYYTAAYNTSGEVIYYDTFCKV